MKTVLLFLKGVAIGIGNMIAGVSGGTIAFIIGVYEEMITAFANITKKFWPNFLYLLKIGIGIVVGVAITAKILNILFQMLLLEVVCLFVGVIIGGLIYDIPELKLTEDEMHNKPWRFFLAMGIAILVIIALSVVNVVFSKGGASPQDRFDNVGIKEMIYLFLLIIPGTMCMLFPGISGSLLFMVLGLYYPVLNAINDFIHFSNWGEPGFFLYLIKIIVPLLLGAGLTLLFISKPIKWLFNKYPKVCLYVIMGFVSASVFAIFIVNYELIVKAYTWWHMLISVFVLILGIFISIFLKRLSNKRKEEIEVKENTNPVE